MEQMGSVAEVDGGNADDVVEALGKDAKIIKIWWSQNMGDVKSFPTS